MGYRSGGPGIDYGTGSSIRWKENIKLIDSPLDKVLRLRGVYFDWKKDKGGKHDVGMIAEEVRDILPEIVQNDREDPKYAEGMDYSKLTPLLVEAIKEQQKEIDILKNQLKNLNK